MEILSLFFKGGFNKILWYAILLTIIFILLIFLDRMLFNLIPNVLIGLTGLLALATWIYYFLSNFILNLWNSNTGKAIILGVSFILIAIILTTSFSTQKTVITKVGQSISPVKIGKNIKKIR